MKTKRGRKEDIYVKWQKKDRLLIATAGLSIQTRYFQPRYLQSPEYLIKPVELGLAVSAQKR
jgi:hypothetical protein